MESPKWLSEYPLRVQQKSETQDGIGTRSMSRGELIEFGSTTNSKKSFQSQLEHACLNELKLERELTLTGSRLNIKLTDTLHSQRCTFYWKLGAQGINILQERKSKDYFPKSFCPIEKVCLLLLLTL